MAFEAQRFGPALKVCADALAILLLVVVGTWIRVAHALQEGVVEWNCDHAGGRCHARDLSAREDSRR